MITSPRTSRAAKRSPMFRFKIAHCGCMYCAYFVNHLENQSLNLGFAGPF